MPFSTDSDMLHIGNGYMPDNGNVALQLLRDYPVLRAIFVRRFG